MINLVYDINKSQVDSTEDKIKNLVDRKISLMYKDIGIILQKRKMTRYYFDMSVMKLHLKPSSLKVGDKLCIKKILL